MHQDLTQGSITRGLIRFSLPLMAGTLLQQTYNLADTWIVGRVLGENALAAVGSAFSVMVLLTSILTGLCMGAGVVVSQLYGQKNEGGMRLAAGNALVLIAAVAALLTAGAYSLRHPLMSLMNVPPAVQADLLAYLTIVFSGIIPVFFYNYTACLLRAVGASLAPLMFLLLSTVTNVALDILFVAVLGMGIPGAALATVIAQWLCAIACAVCFVRLAPGLAPTRDDLRIRPGLCRRIFAVSALTSIQQSIMNFGILMVQSLVNSFGVSAMAAFAAQNTGAGNTARLRQGFRTALGMTVIFCGAVSVLVCLFARPLLQLFLDPGAAEALAIGVTYLRTEGACYVGIGVLFLLYAVWRGMERAGMSVVLTVLSLGSRVALAYAFAPRFGLMAVWLAIPIGWALADAVGLIALRRHLH